MILKYGSFILEKLILESNVVYSDKFKKVLRKMPDSAIAQKLLEIEDRDLNVVSNFFDVKIDDDSVVTFTNDRAAQAILNDEREYVRYTGRRGGWLTNNLATNGAIFARLGFEPKTEAVFQPNNTDIGEVISKVTSERTNKTWCYVKFPTGEGVYNVEKLVTAVTPADKKKKVFNSGRQEIRVGRAVRALLRADGSDGGISDADIETFVNSFRSNLSIINDVFSRFEIVEGDQLGFWYNRNNYEFPHQGTLGSSCQAVGRLDWLEIYIKNPETVKLLILKSENTDDKIVGRALLWKLDDDRTFMDYIYCSRQADDNVFREYANSKGWIHDRGGAGLVATIKPEPCAKYPSIDTMRYCDFRTGKISNRRFEGSREIHWSQDDGDEEFDDDDY